MHQKLGISVDNNSRKLIDDLFNLMDKYNTNFTNTFRILTSADSEVDSLAIKLSEEGSPTHLIAKYLRSFPQIIGMDVSNIRDQD